MRSWTAFFVSLWFSLSFLLCFVFFFLFFHLFPFFFLSFPFISLYFYPSLATFFFSIFIRGFASVTPSNDSIRQPKSLLKCSALKKSSETLLRCPRSVAGSFPASGKSSFSSLFFLHIYITITTKNIRYTFPGIIVSSFSLKMFNSSISEWHSLKHGSTHSTALCTCAECSLQT
uniref:Uncharacterized protein n=1 Tax=Rhipicephalus pulchellus TaxID=72859 RepID=L7LX06_RHIPC